MQPPKGKPETIGEGGTPVTFEEAFVPAPSGTPAMPRASGHPREVPTPADPKDEAFALELADRVQEYVRRRTSGLSAEQLAALVQQFLSRRSA